MKIEIYLDEIDEELWSLLLSADPDEAKVKAYLRKSGIFVAFSGGCKIGVAVLSTNAGDFELKNIAVHSSKQGTGVAKSLIAVVKERAKELGARFLFVGTGNSSLDQIGLYQKCGFRLFTIKQNFFADYDSPIYENGIRCLDLVVLRSEL